MSSARSNPSPCYQIGGSLRVGDPHYVLREADTDLYNALKAGEFCYVLNSRQMGKSSLRVRTRHRLEREGCRCASLDLTGIGSHNITPNQWYKGIASELWRGFGLTAHLKLKAWWAQQDDFSPVQRLHRFLAEVVLQYVPSDRIVIFVDEIDSVLSLPFSSDDLFALIRFCFNQRAEDPNYARLTFALFGVATPTNLIRDPQRTPFNIGRAIALQGFQPHEIEPLTIGLQAYVRDPAAILTAILAWTKGQPFLTQKLCQLAIQARLAMGERTIPPGEEQAWIDRLVKTQIVEYWEEKDEPEHLRTIRDRLLRDRDLASSALALYQQILEQGGATAKDWSPAQSELLLSGLVCKRHQRLIVRNRIYRAIFNATWVQQRLAALRPYDTALASWRAAGCQDDSRLLRGRALQDARTWAAGKELSALDYRFLTASERCDRHETELALRAENLKAVEARLQQEQRTARLQRWLLGAMGFGFVAATALGLFALWEYRRVVADERIHRLQEVQNLVASARALFASDRGLDALIESIRAMQHIQQLSDPPPEVAAEADFMLREAFYRIAEHNRLEGHRSDVYAVAISPKGDLIASGSRDRTIRLMRQDGTFLGTLPLAGKRGHRDVIQDLDFSPAGDLLASAANDGAIRLWSTQGQVLQTIFGHNGPVLAVKFSPDGTWLASASTDATLKIWDRNGALKTSFAGFTNEILALAISPDGQFLAAGGRDGRVHLWQLGTDAPDPLVRVYPNQGSTVREIAFSPDGQVLAVGGDDRQVRLWHRDGRLARTLTGHQAPVQSLAFTNDGRQLVTGSWDGNLKIWDWSAGTLLRTLQGHKDRVWDLAFSDDGALLASASWDDTVRIWQPHNPALTTFRGHMAAILDVAIAPDSQFVATASDDRTVRLWHADGRELMTLAGHSAEVYSVAFSPDSQILASAGLDGTIGLWTQAGTSLHVIDDAHAGAIWSVRFSPNGQWLASGGNDRAIKLWKPDGTPVRAFEKDHTNIIRQVVFAPDGSAIASASLDRTAKVWSLDGRVLSTLQGHTAEVNGVAFSPDGQVLATASTDRTVRLWQRDGTPLQVLQGHTGEVFSVTFSPDGQMLASAGWDDTIRLWSLEGEPLAVLNGHSERVWRLAFSPDGRRLLSGSDDRTAIAWDLDRVVARDRVLAESCAWVRDFLRTNPQVLSGDRHLCAEAFAPE